MARTFYEVLMVDARADREVILVVYRHLAKRYHPDRDASPEAARRMAELNEAWATLGDAAKRREYDQAVGVLSGDVPVVVRGHGRPTRAGVATEAGPTPTSPYGEAGAPPARPAAVGRPLTFGRYRGWTLNQVARFDADYLEWLSRTTMGRNYKRELDQLRRPR